jgi:hypothetical protein
MGRNITPVAAILDRLDDPALGLHDSYFLTYGDDALDVVIGLDVIRRNRWLLNADPFPTGAYEGDAICVGSGPSLDQYLPLLEQIKDRVLIVAAHSAIQKLLSHGIVPHLVTPKERLPDPKKIPIPLPESVIYAGLPLVPGAPDMCSRHYLVGDLGKMSQWLGTSRENIAVSTTSGTLSTYIAGTVATGTIWLVGHDLVQGHFKGFAHLEERQLGTSLCVDGVERPSNRVYRAAVEELSGSPFAHRLVQTAPGGAVLENARYGVLEPSLGPSPCLSPTPVSREHRPSPLDRLPAIWDKVITGISEAKTSADLSVAALFAPEDKALGEVLCQANYLSASILRRTIPLTEDQVFVMLRDGLDHGFRSLRGWAHGPR